MRKLSTNQFGVTLVEMLITMGLLAFFLVITASMFTATIDTQNQSTGYNAVLSDGRFIMTRLNYDIARATAISTPTSLGGSASSLVMTVGGNTYTYALSGNNLQLTDNIGTANLNGNGTTISSLTFQRLGNTSGKDTVRYTFTVTSTARHNSGTDVQIFTSTQEER